MDPYRYIEYLRILGRVTLIWPSELKVSRCEFVFTIFIWLNVIVFNSLSMVFLTIHVIQDKLDPLDLSNTLCILGVLIDCFLQMILVRIQWPRFQNLIHEITEFMRCATLNEKIVCWKYIKQYWGYHCFLGSMIIVGILIYLTGPLTLGKRFPVDAWYPFSIDPLGTYIFIYCVQSIMFLEAFTYVSLDSVIILVISYLTARFELLGEEFCKVRTHGQFRDCVRKHKELLRFVKETERAIRLLVLKTLGLGIVVVVASALLVSNFHDFTTLTQSSVVFFGTTLRLFGYAWATNNLTDKAASLSWSIFQPEAIGKPLNLDKSMLIVIQMTQRSIAFNLWGMDLKLSLSLFTQYVLKVFSFYMTMRVVVNRYV